MVTTEELTTASATRWREVLAIDTSVFGSVEFARIMEEHRNAPARLFVVASPKATIAYPYLLRPIAALPFAAEGENADLCDVRTPEYTGPLASGSDASDLGFPERFSAHCVRNGIVTEFAHLHPWHAEEGAVPPADLGTDRQIVYVDLGLDEQQLWRTSLRASGRKNVNRAVGEGVEVRTVSGEEGIREFHRIYSLTMDRVGAEPRYRFSYDYFRAIHETMPGNSDFTLAMNGSRAIAALLVLHDATDAYTYLGGVDLEHSSLRPSNLLYYQALLVAKERGQRRFVLGGGHRPDDGVFRFKATFSPLRAAFSVVRRVHVADAYHALNDAWSRFYGRPVVPTGFFPPYRQVPADPPATAPARP